MNPNAVRQRTFEHDMVKMLLARFNFPDKKYKQYLAELREAGRREGSDGYLTFSSLVATERFHNCPVRLQAHSVGGDVGRVALPYLMKFEKSYFYNRYCVGWLNRDPHDTRPPGYIRA